MMKKANLYNLWKLILQELTNNYALQAKESKIKNLNIFIIKELFQDKQ